MTVEERLEAMQRELDAWKRFTRWMLVPVVLVVAGAVAWGGFMGKPVQAQGGKEVRAEKFVVVDQQGEMRAYLGVDDDGSPSLGMADAQGKARTGLRVRADGSPSLVMADAQGEAKVGLAVDDDGDPVLQMHDAQGAVRAVLGKTQLKDKTGSTIIRPPSSLVLFNEKGNVVYTAP